MKILITGGAGFVGSSLAKQFKSKFPNAKVVVFDNLRRRGSELNLAVFKKHGVDFIHGDIRNISDFSSLQENFDFLIEASAEPSVHAGTAGSSVNYLIDTNLYGTFNCLEFARQRVDKMIFLSTSRVYSIPALKRIQLAENATRFLVTENQTESGISQKGISEEFATVNGGFRSLYGSTKLASEMFIEEYAFNFGTNAIINRCGVLAGPGQFGKTDQGVFTLWVAKHLFSGKLSYTGFGGTGKQIRDILHPRDLFELLLLQIESDNWRAPVYNVGGGMEGSVSLFEYTQICREVTGNSIPIGNNPETAEVDIPFYVSDTSKVRQKFHWKPASGPKIIVKEIFEWISNDRDRLSEIFE